MWPWDISTGVNAKAGAQLELCPAAGVPRGTRGVASSVLNTPHTGVIDAQNTDSHPKK